MVTSPPPDPRNRRVSSSSTSTGLKIPPPPQTSPRSSVYQWLDALDTQAPPPTPYRLRNQCRYTPVSRVPFRLGILHPRWHISQRVRSSRHSQMSRRSRFSISSATVIQGVVDFSSKVTDSLVHLAEGTRIDAAHRDYAMHHEYLAHEQCHRIQASERERVHREEALERDRVQ